MNKLTRITALSSAGVLMVSALAGCSAYNNPGKYITVPDKGSLVINQSKIDEEYAEQLNTVLEKYRETEYTELTDKDETVKDGDKVNIDYTGRSGEDGFTLTEDQLKNMAATKFDLVIGSGTFISAYENKDDESKNTKGFEEQLIDHKVGETFDITVTFPDSYSNDKTLEGKVIIFTITIHKISRAYVHDDSTITVDYAFTEKTDSDDEDKDNTDESGEDEAKAQSEEDKDSTESGETTGENGETGEDNKDEDKDEDKKPADLSKVFKDDDFEIDYTEEIDKEATFNDLFKIADYADIFKEKVWGYEYTFDYTVPEDVDDDYKDYIGRTVTVTLTLSDITHLPELTDDLVSKYTSEEYTTVSDFEAYLNKTVLADLAYDAILEATVVKEYPKSERNKIYKNYVNQLVYNKLGADPSTMTQADLDAKLTDEVYQSIYAQAASSTLTALKERLVLEYLLDVYDIKLTNKEYKTQLSDMFKANQMYYMYYYQIYNESALENYMGKESLQLQFKATKLMDKIGDYVTVDANA